MDIGVLEVVGMGKFGHNVKQPWSNSTMSAKIKPLCYGSTKRNMAPLLCSILGSTWSWDKLQM